MKKEIFTLISFLISIMSYAQCPTEATDDYGVPVDSSLLTINGHRRADCDAYIKGSFNPLYIHRCGVPSNGFSSPMWYYGLLCESDMHDYGYNMGVVGRILNDGTHHNSGRAYGVMGTAKGYSSGYTYGVFGRLEGSRNGAAIYGTSSQSNNGVNTEGRYAGYFHGNVRVTDTLKTASILANAYLGPAFSQEMMMPVGNTYAENGEELTTSQKLSSLTEYMYVAEEPERVMTLDADTIDYESLNNVDKAYYSRPHHGLSADDMEKVYPELVYENEDGSKNINYMELIPILVQAINLLQNEVNELKGNYNTTTPKYNKAPSTDISTIVNEDNTLSYDLQGRRFNIERNSKIIIRDGQKTLVK